MIECYFSSCNCHSKDEPFCLDLRCSKNKDEIKEFTKIREKYLEGLNKQERTK